jgi:hypothetical protein
MFYAIEPIFEGIVGVETHFLVFQPRLVLGGTEVTRSSFHLLLSRIRFRRYRGGLVQFSCFVLPNSFSAVPRVLGPFLCLAITDSFSAAPK